MNHLILTINPGSTSTKIGVFHHLEPIFTKTIDHNHQEIQKFPTIAGQKDFRLQFVLSALAEHGIDPASFTGVVGIGGLLPPIKTGGYKVTPKMVDLLENERSIAPHASNLGALLADLIAKKSGCNAYIYDAVSAGILPEVAQVTGIPEIKRYSLSHVLNCRAQAIQYAVQIGKKFEELTIIVAHLGGGVSLAVYEKGNMADSIGDDLGPFSSERAGAVPLMQFIDFCYDNGLTKKEARTRVRGNGGLKAHLGTASMKEVEDMIQAGDKKAALVVDAMTYGVAKGIGSLAAAVSGRVDAIILTGGIARSQRVTGAIESRVQFIAPVVVSPGEYELEALAAGCLRIITGEEVAHEL